MKVLVSTKETQGQRKNDFSHTKEGELVRFGFECDGESVDGKCGCRRAFSGFFSHVGTTTAKVVDQPDLTPETYTDMMILSMKEGGWITEGDEEDLAWAKRDAKELMDMAEHFPLGVIIEKRGRGIQERRPLPTKKA